MEPEMVGKRDKECSERAYNEETDKTQGFPRMNREIPKKTGRETLHLPPRYETGPRLG